VDVGSGSANEELLPCPLCGGPMQRVVSLDGSGPSFICPVCAADPKPSSDAVDPKAADTKPDTLEPSERFKQLLQQSDKKQDPDWIPDELLEDLPPEAQTLLKGRLSAPVTGADETLSEQKLHHLRQQGYVIDQDAHGVRIGGRLSGSPSQDRGLSASDIVRLAAELDGGLATRGERIKCPNCEALNPPGQRTCQWCGERLPDKSPEA
jgi:hypothetical protein